MIVSILIFLAVLSLLVLVHEFGHFWVARRAGVLVEEFGFGLPPKIFGKKIGQTVYSLNALPFGGFVRLYGENSEHVTSKPQRAFVTKSKKVRSVIVVAGVVMNFLLAIVLFSITYSFTGIPRQSENVKILEVAEGAPAAEAGLMAGDYVRYVDDEKITSPDQFINAVSGAEGAIDVTIERSGETSELEMTPRSEHPEDQGPLGVVISATEIYFPPVWQRPFYGAYYGTQEAIFWGKAVVVGFVTIFKNLFSGQVPTDLAGPVGIYAITTEAASVGMLALINFVGVLSVNLAILNLIPFPALDGGRLFFILVEGLLGRRVLPKLENYAHMVGMAVLIILIILITLSDVKRLVSAGSISGFIDSFIP